MPAPRNFAGVFYAGANGVDELFDNPLDFLHKHEGKFNGLYRSVWAIVDLMINDCNEVLAVIEDAANTAYPDADWIRINRMLSDVQQVSLQAEDSHEAIFRLVDDCMIPLPGGYASYLFGPDEVDEFRWLHNHPEDWIRLLGRACYMAYRGVVCLIELQLNGYTDLVQSLVPVVIEVWPELNEEMIKRELFIADSIGTPQGFEDLYARLQQDYSF